MAESEKEHNSVKLRYQNPSLSGSQDIVLTMFSIDIMVELKKGHRLANISWN